MVFTFTLPGFRALAAHFGIFVACVVFGSTLDLCRAADYYFSSLGNDAAGLGSLVSPWQSISKLNALNLDPGDNVLFRAGDTFAGNILLDANDTANSAFGVFGGSPITLGAYGSGTRPIISAASGNALRATNAAGLEIRDLEFAGSGVNITNVSNVTKGLVFENTQTNFRQQHIRLDNLAVHGFGQDGINFHAQNPSINSGGFSDVQIMNSEIYSNGRSGISSSASSSNGLVVGGSAYDYQSRAHGDFLVANNVVRNTTGKSETSGVSGNGIVLAQIDGAVIERNVAHHNGGMAGGGGVAIWTWEANNVNIRFNEAYSNSTFDGRDGGGFDLDGGVTNSVMQYNYSHGNYGAGLGLFEFGYASPMGHNTIRYNISEADGGGVAVYGNGPRFPGNDLAEDTIFHNNTIVHPTGSALHFFGSVDDVGLYNNIVMTKNGQPAIKLEDYDGAGTDYLLDVQLLRNAYWNTSGAFSIVWNGTTYNSLAAWANTTGQEKIAGSLVGLQVDPKLIGPFNGGITLNDANLLESLVAYRMRTISTLANAGANLSSLSLPVSLGLTDPGQRDFFGDHIPVGGTLDIGGHERPIAGDFNGDGTVDAADYVLWRDTLASTTKLYADASDNGVIDMADYDIWKANFGATPGSGTAVGDSGMVPEPSTILILAYSVISIGLFLRRRFQCGN